MYDNAFEKKRLDKGLQFWVFISKSSNTTIGREFKTVVRYETNHVKKLGLSEPTKPIMQKILHFRRLQNQSCKRFWTFGGYKTDHAKDFGLSEATKLILQNILDFRRLQNRSCKRFWTFGGCKSNKTKTSCS